MGGRNTDHLLVGAVMSALLAPFGPLYPALGASVARFRKIDNPTALQAHGAEVERAIRALQRQELQRVLPSIAPSCASGTWHNNADGSIGRSLRERQRAALLRCPEQIRKKRLPHEWQKLYEQAMKEKHGEREDAA